jgi:hypothetical protein
MSQLTHAGRRSRRRARLAACALLLALAAFALGLIGRPSADEGKPSDDAPAAVSNVAVGRADGHHSTWRPLRGRCAVSRG